ncbi:MAG: hypothetical protein RR191_06790 [Cetobacterium sp.]|uniref:hypothetical protein n=1 Tax=Cetobacterium sp. TaxID=2071632 RepID=UPI002FC76CF2
MIKPQRGRWISLGRGVPGETIKYSLYNEKCHRKVFNKMVDKFLDCTDFPIEKVVYKKWHNRHFYQINNNILITIMVGVDQDNLGKLTGASMKIQSSAKLPLDNDMIEHKTKFCKENKGE